MADVFKIVDRFKITGRGTVYTITLSEKAVLSTGDILYDLRGNRFKTAGFEMIRRLCDAEHYGDLQGVLFELIDGVEAEGNVLVRSLTDINFIFCNHVLYPQRVDEAFEKEYQAAGLEHPCALFSYEDLETGKLSLYGENISGLTIYRGWMMKPELYRTFYKKLEERGILLINTPEEYERYHMLPGWYDDFKEYTPKSVWETQGTVESAMHLTRGLEGSYIVKDYVKSRKHEWYDACFIKNIADKKNTESVIRNFIERQESDLVGGVVLRKYEKLVPAGFNEKSGMPLSEEYRVFVYAGRVMMIDDYWDTGKKAALSAEEKTWVESLVDKIKSNFVTIDIARCEDGKLIVMELGDGQVSGLQQIDPQDFYRAFNPEIIRLEDQPVEEFFPDGAVILAGDPMPDISEEEMRARISLITTTQELVDAYVNVHNKFWYIEDEVYDYEEGTNEYTAACETVDAWGEMMRELDQRIMEIAEERGLLDERKPNSGTVKQLERFMNEYGYRNGCGWWVKKSNEQ